MFFIKINQNIFLVYLILQNFVKILANPVFKNVKLNCYLEKKINNKY